MCNAASRSNAVVIFSPCIKVSTGHSVTCPLGHWVAGQREALRARIPASPLLGSSGPEPAACSAPEEQGAPVLLQVPCTAHRARASPGGGEMTWVPPILGGSLSSFPAFCIFFAPQTPILLTSCHITTLPWATFTPASPRGPCLIPSLCGAHRMPAPQRQTVPPPAGPLH